MSYPEKDTLLRHPCTHVGNGIYKVDEPFRIDLSDWSIHRYNYDYILVCINYSKFHNDCDVIYFSRDSSIMDKEVIRELIKPFPGITKVGVSPTVLRGHVEKLVPHYPGFNTLSVYYNFDEENKEVLWITM